LDSNPFRFFWGQSHTLSGHAVYFGKMTIHRQWVEIMKNTCPDAFSKEVPFTANVAFIDAQIKLMGVSKHQTTWEEFLRQFSSRVDHFWR